jgi:hypothetical protein
MLLHDREAHGHFLRVYDTHMASHRFMQKQADQQE